MQGTRGSKSLSSSSITTPPPRPPPSMGLGSGLGLGSGAGPTMTADKEKERKGSARKKLPTPKEMVAHYESQGMQPQEASLKVIDDLQNLLLRVVSSSKKSNQDAITTRLLRLESKLESKPGYPQTLAIGIVSGAAFQVFPQVAASVVHIWNSVRASSSSSSSC